MSRFRTLSRVYGVVAPALQSRIANNIDKMIEDMLDAAVERWAATGYKRFNDHEANCTMQLYRWSDEIVRTRADLRILAVQLEWIQPTPEILAGDADATQSVRPDIRVGIGRVTSVVVECKRLSLKNAHPRLYVDEGMARFVAGEYAPNETRGAMVGYIQADDPVSIVAAINAAVVTHPLMGESHQLKGRSPLSTIRFVYVSQHTRVINSSIRLSHYHVDLRV